MGLTALFNANYAVKLLGMNIDLGTFSKKRTITKADSQ